MQTSNSEMQPTGAALMRDMNMAGQAQALEEALLRVSRDVVLVQDRDTRVCWHNGQLEMHRGGAGRGWSCRRITAEQLVKMAPAKRVLEVLGEAY